jgi:hypothetical protein
LEQIAQIRTTRVVLAAAHLDHDPTNNRLRNLRSFCQRCHLIHDHPHHLAMRRITYLLRRALVDPFPGIISGRMIPLQDGRSGWDSARCQMRLPAAHGCAGQHRVGA